MTQLDCRPLSWWGSESAAATPGRPVFIDPGGRTHSYQDVDKAVRAVAATLTARGVTRPDRLAVVMARGPELAATLLGALSVAAVAPLAPSSPAEVLVDSFRRLGVSGVAVDDDPPTVVIEAAARAGVPVIPLNPFRLDGLAGWPSAKPYPHDLALLLQTSGTTDRPKVVPLTHANLQASTGWLARTLRLAPEDRGLLVMPLFHISGIVASLLAPLMAGGSVICCRGTAPDELLDAVLDLHPTWLSASPAFLHALLSEAASRGWDAVPSRLRFLRTAGSPLDRELAARLTAVFGVPVLESYGMTEVAGVDLYAIRGNSRAGEPEVAVLDSFGRPQPPGVPGEISVRGDNVTAGYEGAPHSGWTGESGAERWFRTGDEGYVDMTGRLVLSGRIKEMINRGGEKVIPRRVDEALLAHPGVAHAVAFPLPHPTLGEDLAAAVVPIGAAAIDEQQLRRHASNLLPVHEVPSRIVVVTELPRSDAGKLRRSDLAGHLAADLAVLEAEPQGEMEALVVDTFAEVLQQRRPSREANFFMLGGDSLSGQRVISRLGTALGRSLSPVLIFEHPTAHGLAQQLQDCEAIEIADAERISAEIGSAEGPLGGVSFPASSAQARMWFLHQLAPDLTAYHMPVLWRLRGRLDAEALREALNAIVERHPTLRTAFEMRNGEVLQIILAPSAVPLEVETLGDRDLDSVIDGWMNQENSEPFILADGLLLRARLLQVAVDEHVLLVNHHHIASDGWSISVLFRDLAELYNAGLGGRASRLSPLRAYYQDYSAWQRRRLSAGRLDDLLGYWVPQLEGVGVLELPSDRLRPATPSHRGDSVAFRIGPDDVAALESLCRSEGATLQMGLLAVLAALLGRYSRQEDFAIGVPHWGRNHPDLEDLVGLFLNTLPIRVRLDRPHSFRELLRHVRTTSIEAYGHQELPFEQLVDALALQRDTSRNPLVQVMLQLVELSAPSLDGMEGIEAQTESGTDNSVRLDLEFMLRRTPDGALSGTVFFAKDLFGKDRIERLTTHLQALLGSAVRDPDSHHGALVMIPDGERRLIESWQLGPSRELPAHAVHEMFEHQAQRTPDAIAVVAGERQVSYKELNARANRLARHLTTCGIGPQTIVAVCVGRSLEWVTALLATFKAGAVYVPLDPTLPQARIEHMLEVSRAAVLLTDVDSTGRFPAANIPLINLSARLNADPCGNPDAGFCTPDDVAYVLFTSGSTGTPKGVEVEHRVLTNLVCWHADHPRLGRPARTLQFASCGFDVSLQEVFTTLTVGGCLVLVDRETQRDPRLLVSELSLNRVERIFLPYVALEQLAIAATQFGLPDTVSDIVSAGERLALTQPIRKLLAGLPDCRLHNHYGPTETHVVTECELPATVDRWPTEADIGRPAANAEIRIAEPSGQPCPIGIPGEVLIGGISLARGYLNSRELTAETFVPESSPAGSTARRYRSGDLASWHGDGTLTFHGRIDDQIKVRGVRVEPGEIAATLLACKGIAQAAVSLVREGAGQPRLVAYYVPETGSEATAASDLRSFLSERLPDYLIPDAFVELAALPLGPNGKLERRSLPTPAPVEPEHSAGPSSEVQQKLAAIWTDVLGHSSFGVSDNFFLAGGHSLTAVRLAIAIEKLAGRPVPVAQIFRAPTIADQERWILEPPTNTNRSDSESRTEPGNLVALQPHGERPPLYAVHGWGGSVAVYIHLARALAPDRPVLGLQAHEIETGAKFPMVSELADRYAEQILRHHPDGVPIHLIGHSAGGWYAYAVANALRERGAMLGLLGVLDTGVTARVHRRVGLQTLALMIASRSRTHVTSLLSSPDTASRISRLRHLARSGRKHLSAHVLNHGDVDDSLRHATVAEEHADADSDFYVVLHRSYRPERQPITVDVFAPPGRTALHRRLWGFYATGGVRLHPMFDGHQDFIDPDRAPQLAVALERALCHAECVTPPKGRRNPAG